MRRIILIKHAMPDIQADRPAKTWGLSTEGRIASEHLARHLAPYGVTRVVTSEEPKAVQTGEIFARVLDVPAGAAEGLHEHDRTDAPFFPTRETFEAAARNFFAKPHERVWGNESALEALGRFSRALEQVVNRYPQDTLAVVAHGTVISLITARSNPVDGFALWCELALPSFVRLSYPDYKLLELHANLQLPPR